MKLSRLILILCFCAVGCVKQNEVPAFLVIESATLVHEKLNRTFPVSTVYVYQNLLVGAFQPPVKAPILNMNIDTLNFRGGVWKDGDASIRPLYPFWKFDTVGHHFARKEEEFTFNPVFRYYPDSVLAYPFKEDFESGQVKFLPSNNFDSLLTDLKLNQVGPFEGRYCARATMYKDGRNKLDVHSTDIFDLPLNKEVWLEVAYRGNAVLGAGLTYFNDAGVEISDDYFLLQAGYTYFDKDWHLAYFNLKPLISTINQTAPNTKYRLRLYSITSVKDRELNLDYIRILHFK